MKSVVAGSSLSSPVQLRLSLAYVFQVWGRIWAVLSLHFEAAGSHQDEKISMYAIDSLRQLAIKYLERSELANFSFQNDILKPFVVIMRSSKNPHIRALIVECIIQVGPPLYKIPKDENESLVRTRKSGSHTMWIGLAFEWRWKGRDHVNYFEVRIYWGRLERHWDLKFIKSSRIRWWPWPATSK